MNDPSPRGTRRRASTGAGGDTSGQAGVIGIGLAAVLAVALAQGSWRWFATYLGVTLLTVIFAFYRRPEWAPGIRSAYARSLAAYAMVVGLCVAIAVAPMLQRWRLLFPMPETRSGCQEMGRYEVLRARAALGVPAGRDGSAPAFVQEAHRQDAVADCLAATTTLWLPLYAAGAAVLLGAGTWVRDRARAGAAPPSG